MTILSLDCSTSCTGYAIFKERDLIQKGTISASSKDYIERIKTMIKHIKQLLLDYESLNIEKIIIEDVRPDTEGTAKSSHTNKTLMYLQAALTFMIHDELPNISIEYVYPSEWRKNVGIHTGRGIKREELKKEDIKMANSIFGLNTSSDDLADACLIGWSYIVSQNKTGFGCWGF